MIEKVFEYGDVESVSGNPDCGISSGSEMSVEQVVVVRICVIGGKSIEFIPLDQTRRLRPRQ